MTQEILLFEEFIIQTGLVGVGLMLALYAIVVPNFKGQIMDKQVKRFEEAYTELSQAVSEVNKEINKKDLLIKLTEKTENLQKYNEPPFWIIWGVLLDIIFLSIAALLPLLDIIGFRPVVLTQENLLSLSEFLLAAGIISFIIISSKVFSELKEMLTGEFENKRNKAFALLQEVKQLEERAKKIKQ